MRSPDYCGGTGQWRKGMAARELIITDHAA